MMNWLKNLAHNIVFPMNIAIDLFHACMTRRWNEKDGTDDLIANLNAYFKNHVVSLRKHVRTAEDDNNEAPLITICSTFQYFK